MKSALFDSNTAQKFDKIIMCSEILLQIT